LGIGRLKFPARLPVDLSRFGLVVQAVLYDDISFVSFTFEQDGLAASDVDFGQDEIVEALAVSSTIVMLDEGRDLGFEILMEEVVFQQDANPQRLVPAFYFALRLQLSGSAVDLVDLIFR